MTASVTSVETLQKIEGIVEEQLFLLKSVGESWQPSDLLPDMKMDGDWEAKVRALREECEGLSDEMLVVLIGNLVTEEALPSYQTWLNRSEEMRDETGASQSAWGRWTRGWTAEENRHGEVLSKYLYLSGRVNMHSVEVTSQHLIRNGFDLKSENDGYKSLVYVSFQERATKISHANTGKLAENCNNLTLAKICSLIAVDEARHEEAYKRMFGRIIDMDSHRAVLAFESMMRQKIVMPARLMSDGSDRDLFSQFAVVAQKIGVYTASDYAEVIDHLVSYWKVPYLTLTGEAARAQEYLCNLPSQYRSKVDRIHEVVSSLPKEPFDWIFGREV